MTYLPRTIKDEFQPDKINQTVRPMEIKRFCTRVKLTKGLKSYYIQGKEKDNLCCVPPQRANGTVDGVLGSLQAPAGGVRL
jgi:hypothetical protein